MRWKPFVGLGVAVFGVLGCETHGVGGDGVLVRHHFAGLAQLAARPDLSTIHSIFALPESQRLRGEVDRKLAVHMPSWFGADAAGATNHASGLLPWVRAALDNESYLEVLGAEGGVGSWAVAVRMEEAPAVAAGTAMRRVLAPLLEGGTAGDVEGAGDAWELMGKEPGRTPAARFAHVGGWALVGSGKGAFDTIRKRMGTSGVPVAPLSNEVHRVEVALEKLAPLLGWRAEPLAPVSQWPSVRMVVEPRNGRLRTLAELSFVRPLELPLEPWTLPTGVLRDPLVGFTAIQGADRWLGRLALFAPYEITEWPKQFFFWSVAGDPWNQYVAGPMRSPTNLMGKISLPLPMRMVTNMSWRGGVFGLRVTNQATRVEFLGLPYLLPFLQSIQEGETKMLYGGLFPQPPKAEAAPAGLLEQVIGRTNLVLYDWETTGRSVLWTNAPGTAGPRVSTNPIGRLVQFKQLRQYWQLMMNTNTTRVPLTPGGEIWVPGWDWVNTAQAFLGDTITEATRTGPSQVTATRQSQLGFNALELSYLLRWIENPRFPGWTGGTFMPPGAKTVPVPQAPGGAATP